MAVLTGLVYVAVILLWAVVLIPQWLRRHERNSEHRTTLTFHRAMRTLERRRLNRGMSRARHDMDVTVAGARSRVHDRVKVSDDGRSPIDEHLDHGTDPFVGTETEEHLRRVRTLRAKSHAVTVAETRRRQVQQGLVGFAIVGLVVGFLGFVPLFIGLLPAIGLGVFWFASSKQRATANGRQLREKRQQSRAERDVEQAHEDEGSAQHERSSRPRRASSGSAQRRQRQDASRSRRPRRGAPATAEFAPSAADTQPIPELSADYQPEEAWEPSHAPLPGYLDSARATRVPRNLDSSEQGDWTSERMLEQAEALRTPGADVEAELGLDDFVDVPGWDADVDNYRHRRAVNE